jgi:protein TonB
VLDYCKRQLFPLMLVLSVLLHAGAAWVGVVNIQPPSLITPQAGVASISVRSSVAAGPKPSDGGSRSSQRNSAGQLRTLPPRPLPAEPKQPISRPAGKRPPKPVQPERVHPTKATVALPGMKRPDPSPATTFRHDPKPAPAPAQRTPARANQRPSLQAQPALASKDKGKGSGPKLETVSKISDQVSLPSRGSRGSQGSRVDGVPRELATNPSPPYPEEELAAGVEGRVVLWIKIDAAGRVTHVHVHRSSGVTAFDQSALTTVRRWRFIPARRGDEPVPYEVLKAVEFVIDRDR